MNVKQIFMEIFNDKELLDFKPKHPRFWRFVNHFIIAQVFVVLIMFAYIELGHDKGWMRADVWYTCIHTHHHFPWQ